MSCQVKCHKTASLDGSGGHRIMIAQSGNLKYPDHFPHPQCPECVAEEYKEMLAQINRLENPQEQVLFDQFEKVKGKG
jgi:hypothetical protein